VYIFDSDEKCRGRFMLKRLSRAVVLFQFEGIPGSGLFLFSKRDRSHKKSAECLSYDLYQCVKLFAFFFCDNVLYLCRSSLRLCFCVKERERGRILP